MKENIPWGTEFCFLANFTQFLFYEVNMAVYHAFKSRIIGILDLKHDTFVLASIRLTNQKNIRAVLRNLKTKDTKLVISSYKDQLRHA